MAARAKKDESIFETIKTVVYALLIAGVFRTLFFQPFWIPSGSMKDTLLIGDFLFVNKMAYGYSQHSCPFSMCPFSGRIFGSMPERGDVVVFRHPVNGADFIKRLVGLPGDKVQMKDGVLHLNDQPVDLAEVDPFVEVKETQGSQGSRPACANDPVGLGGRCVKERFTETLPGGVSHSILNIGTGPSDNTPAYVVPEGQFFFIGDNRDNSQDSRYPQVGFVPEENIVGKAVRVWMSWDFPSMPNWSRIGNKVE